MSDSSGGVLKQFSLTAVPDPDSSDAIQSVTLADNWLISAVRQHRELACAA